MIKVLIAEDQEIIRQSLEIMLSNKDGIKVVGTARNGKEAVKLVKRLHPNIILMDIRMPEMDGLQCIKIIKKSFHDIKIIVLTTFDDDEYVFAALKNGASGYLLKGISVGELVESIRIVHCGGALINPNVTVKVIDFFSKMVATEYRVDITDEMINTLNKNEMKIVQLIGMGMSNKEITGELNFSEGTIRNYISTILSKLGLRDRTQIAIFAIQSGLSLKRIEG